MTSVIGTQFCLSSFYGEKVKKARMMYKIRQKVLVKSQGMRKAADVAVRKRQMKFSKYEELKSLDGFHSVTPPIKVREKKITPKSVPVKRPPRPSRVASTAASERLTSISSEAFSDDNSDEDFNPQCPSSVRLKKRKVFRDPKDDWSSEDDDWNVGNKKRATLPPPVLSEYEKAIQEKIAARQKFLEELGISETKKELEVLTKSASVKSQKKIGKKPELPPRRIFRNRSSLPSNYKKQAEPSPECSEAKTVLLPDSVADDPVEKTTPQVAVRDVDIATTSADYESDTDTIFRSAVSSRKTISAQDGPSTEKTLDTNEDAGSEKKLPHALKKLQSTAAKAAAKQAKSAKVVSCSLKKNFKKLSQPNSRPRRALRTLKAKKEKFL